MNDKIALVKAYIKELKGKDVDIYIRPDQHERDLTLLNFAYMKAVEFFSNFQKKE